MTPGKNDVVAYLINRIFNPFQTFVKAKRTFRSSKRCPGAIVPDNEPGHVIITARSPNDPPEAQPETSELISITQSESFFSGRENGDVDIGPIPRSLADSYRESVTYWANKEGFCLIQFIL